MEKSEIEELRGRVGCAALLVDDGWKVDVKESTRRAVKYRRDVRIVIVIHDGRGWFDPLSTAKGDVFDLAEHLGAHGFPEASARVAALVGFVPTESSWERQSRPAPVHSVVDRWTRRARPRPGSPTWRYLTGERRIPESIVATAVQQDLLREGPHGSMWAAHRDAGGVLLGWEERGPQWRGFASGGAKELLRLGPSAASRICITEAAIDAMSLAAIQVLRPDTLYVSTGGGWSPSSEKEIRHLAQRRGTRLVAATDNNRQGDVYAERIRLIASETGAGYARSRPRTGDWNEDLKALLARIESEPLAKAG
jgi:hypothetical protein